MAEEIAERFVALYDPARPQADIPVMPIIEDICVREGLSVDELDRLVTHFGAVADEFSEARLLAAEPAGRA
ncbi:hypothetical protein [Methylobacterium sp. J-070]|uniref:hypothetical protein n=1 Tax=Methylobacterium sp. J-070 TaxID=2836650 RepID=UPI001FB8E2C5|nr:hypothetical protein [Methylobacterium sp. J-070]MCJ2048535.1 hypothetical protein [Methylobacterium sp. J-070]